MAAPVRSSDEGNSDVWVETVSRKSAISQCVDSVVVTGVAIYSYFIAILGLTAKKLKLKQLTVLTDY